MHAACGMRRVADPRFIGAAYLAFCSISCGSSTGLTEIAGPDAARCDTRVASQASTIPAEGGRLSVAITTGRDCTWTAASEAFWLTVSPSSGQGNGAVTVVAAENGNRTVRSAGVVISGPSNQTAAGTRVTLTQAAAPPPPDPVATDPTPPSNPGSPPGPGPAPAPGPTPPPPSGSGPNPPPSVTCSFEVGPEQQSFSADGGSGQVRIRTQSSCEWSASSSAGWIEIGAGAQGRGNDDVSYRVGRNTAAQARSGSISVGGRAVRIEQAAAAPPPPPQPPPPACTFQLSPDRRSFNAEGGEHHVNVQTASGCSWRASSSASWIVIGSPNGSGQRQLDYRVLPNTTSQERTGSISIGGQAHQVEQRGRR